MPLQFLKAVLPNPGDLGKTLSKACIGNIVSGMHEGKARSVYLYNICDHEACFAEVGNQAVSYTTGVPAMIGAALMLNGTWMQAGVFNLEQLDPDPFMDMLNAHGLPRNIVICLKRWSLTDVENAIFGPGSFADFDLSRVPSPCFVVDEARLRQNLEILRGVSATADAKILLALKAFAMWSLAPLISEHLSGTVASGLWEAKLARKHFGGELATYAPAFKTSEFDEIAALSDHIVFNSPAQIERFLTALWQPKTDIALRINPEHSEAEIALYDPCASGSRLGYPISQIETLLDGLTGLRA